MDLKAVNAADDGVDIKNYKRFEPTESERPYLIRQLSSDHSNSDCNGSIVVGCLYEIDHNKLPPKSPSHLKSIRTVMVSEKTIANVSVKFPSISSLRRYFGKDREEETERKQQKEIYPELDEQFIMGPNLAVKVLRRLLSPSEFASQRHLESFWLVSDAVKLKTTDHRSVVVKEQLAGNKIPAGQSCPNASGLMTWGVRQRVRFIGKHREESSLKGSKDLIDPNQTANGLRKRFSENSGGGGWKKAAKKEKLTATMKLPKDMQGRWSMERYKTAQLKLLDIMHAKGAVLGKPILRPVLREEARKHIGDTGLLDHLLKHMTDTVVANGERFRRRHNTDGAMEYWLEAAGLTELRNAIGVQDPFWAPPPGWKPGNDLLGIAISTSETKELKLLKEEVAEIKRYLENLRSINATAVSTIKQENEIDTTSVNVDGQKEPDLVSRFQESYNNLLKQKGKLEDQLIEVSISLKQMKEEIQQLMDVGAGQALKKQPQHMVRSGFRMCKPEGTFLWPNMGNRHNTISVEEILLPNPPSVSSNTTTSAPFPHWLAPPTSPVKPIAKNMAALAAAAGALPEIGSGGKIRLNRNDSTGSNESISASCSYAKLENLPCLQASAAGKSPIAQERGELPRDSGKSMITDPTRQTASISLWPASG